MITNPIFLSIFDNDIQKNKQKRLGMIYGFYRIIIAVFFSMNFLVAIQKSNQDLMVITNFLPTFIYVFLYTMIRKHLLILAFYLAYLFALIEVYDSLKTNKQKLILLFLTMIECCYICLRYERNI